MAIGQLGFGPCHQMTEIADAPDQHAFWQTQAEGQEVDWVEVFARYQSQVNFPGTLSGTRFRLHSRTPTCSIPSVLKKHDGQLLGHYQQALDAQDATGHATADCRNL